MSGFAQTPASRRFLASQSHTGPGSQGQPASSRRSQFLRPSHATSSSPYAVSPWARPPPIKDDIETSFEVEVDNEDEHGSSHIRSAVKGDNRKLRAGDWIEDETTIESSLPQSHHSKRATRHFLKQLSPTTHAVDGDLVDGGQQFSSPLPKRQKRTHHVTSNPDPILISSSPSPSNIGQDSDEETGADLSQADGQDMDHDEVMDDGYNDVISEPIPKSSLSATKFLPPTPARFPPAGSPTRPGFRTFNPKMANGSTTHSDTALPDAFSPSKRRGKREYLRGGAAETVRGWILHMANGDLSTIAQPEHVISVRPISTDPSGRFEITVDDDGRTWMLVRQDDRPSRSSSLSQLVDAEGLVKVALKGTSTTWTVQGAAGLPLRIAVLWNVVK